MIWEAGLEIKGRAASADHQNLEDFTITPDIKERVVPIIDFHIASSMALFFMDNRCFSCHAGCAIQNGNSRL